MRSLSTQSVAHSTSRLLPVLMLRERGQHALGQADGAPARGGLGTRPSGWAFLSRGGPRAVRW